MYTGSFHDLIFCFLFCYNVGYCIFSISKLQGMFVVFMWLCCNGFFADMFRYFALVEVTIYANIYFIFNLRRSYLDNYE